MNRAIVLLVVALVGFSLIPSAAVAQEDGTSLEDAVQTIVDNTEPADATEDQIQTVRSYAENTDEVSGNVEEWLNEVDSDSSESDENDTQEDDGTTSLRDTVRTIIDNTKPGEANEDQVRIVGSYVDSAEEVPEDIQNWYDEAQPDSNTDSGTTEEPEEEVRNVIYELGSVTVHEESFDEGYIIVSASQETDITLSTKTMITATSGDVYHYTIDDTQTKIDLQDAAWYTISNQDQFVERFATLSIQLLYEAASWKYVIQAGFIGIVMLAISLAYYHWSVTRQEKKGFRSLLTDEVYDEYTETESEVVEDE